MVTAIDCLQSLMEISSIYMLYEILNSKRNPEKNPTSADTKGNFKMSINKVNGLLCSNMFFQEATKVLLKANPKA